MGEIYKKLKIKDNNIFIKEKDILKHKDVIKEKIEKDFYNLFHSFFPELIDYPIFLKLFISRIKLLFEKKNYDKRYAIFKVEIIRMVNKSNDENAQTFLTNLNIKFKYIKNNVFELRKKQELYDLINIYLGIDPEAKKNNGEVFTPFNLINKMLDTLPKEVWSNPNLTWLDPANGIGNFPSVIIERLMEGLKTFETDDDKRYKHIMEQMIYTVDLVDKNTWLYYNIFDPNDEFDMNHFQGSFLDDDFDKHMKDVWKIDKFDIILGNPPYQDSSKNNTATSLWIPFVDKAINITSNYLLYVTPINWLNIKLSKYHSFRKYNLEKVFIFSNENTPFKNIKIDVGYYLINVNKSFKTPTLINNKYIINISEYGNLPKNIYNINSLNIWSKLMKNNETFEISRKNQIHTQRKNLWREDKDDIYKYRTVKTINKNEIVYYWSNEKKSNYDDIKVMIPESKSHLKSFIGDKCNTTQGIFYIKMKNKIEAENFLSILKSPLYSYLLNVSKWSPALPQSTLETLPMIDISKSWTDKELYNYFNLSKEEIDLIEKTQK